MTGVAGGVKREGMLIVVGDAGARLTEEVERDWLGTVVAAAWLPAIDVEMVEAVDTGGL